MIVKVYNGDLFQSKCQTLVNTVNCVGVMGKGIALEFKKRYPAMFERYKEYCSRKLLTIDKLFLFKDTGDNHYVLNFPTKIHWRNPSQIEWIETNLMHFVKTYKERGITSAAFPLLGCTNGKLDKEEVIPLMEKYLSQCDILIEIYIR